MRYHSFLVYFSVLKRLHWVQLTSESEVSSIQDNYPDAPDRAYYRLTQAGKEDGEDLWLNPQYALYPENGRNHQSKQTVWPHRKVRTPQRQSDREIQLTRGIATKRVERNSYATLVRLFINALVSW